MKSLFLIFLLSAFLLVNADELNIVKDFLSNPMPAVLDQSQDINIQDISKNVEVKGLLRRVYSYIDGKLYPVEKNRFILDKIWEYLSAIPKKAIEILKRIA